jgi:hypothetical protein
LRPKRSPEAAKLVADTRELDATLFAMVQAREIRGDQRDVVSGRLTEARQLAEKGHIGQAQEMVAHAAAVVAKWQKSPFGSQTWLASPDPDLTAAHRLSARTGRIQRLDSGAIRTGVSPTRRPYPTKKLPPGGAF